MPDGPSPQNIFTVGYSYIAARALFSANELGVFTALAEEPRSGDTLVRALDLHPRGAKALLDTLVSLGLLDREGEDLYRNTPEGDRFLVKGRADYAGGLLDLLGGHVWHNVNGLTDTIRTGREQSKSRDTENGNVFDELYGNEELLKTFVTAMSALSIEPSHALTTAFPWHDYRSVVDIGTAEGRFPVTLARAHSHLAVGGFDLPPIGPIFTDYVARNGLADRISFTPGDFFADDLPSADVLVMGHVLHDWDLPEKKTLLRKAFEALPQHGALVVYEAIIDDDRRTNVLGLLTNLAMLTETSAGSDYTAAECTAWMREAGFARCSVEQLTASHSMVVGYK
jgi:hypothetical protein